MTSRIEDILRELASDAYGQGYEPSDHRNNQVAFEKLITHALDEIRGLLPKKKFYGGLNNRGIVEDEWQYAVNKFAVSGFNSAIDEISKLFGKGE